MEKGRYYFSGELEVIGTYNGGGRAYLRVRPDEDTEWLLLPEGWLDAEKVVEEPPLWSVVLDDDGDAWQRNDEGWAMALRGEHSDKQGWSWDMLVDTFGVAKVLHEPDPED